VGWAGLGWAGEGLQYRSLTIAADAYSERSDQFRCDSSSCVRDWSSCFQVLYFPFGGRLNSPPTQACCATFSYRSSTWVQRIALVRLRSALNHGCAHGADMSQSPVASSACAAASWASSPSTLASERSVRDCRSGHGGVTHWSTIATSSAAHAASCALLDLNLGLCSWIWISVSDCVTSARVTRSLKATHLRG
jgi:hypothetical protein